MQTIEYQKKQLIDNAIKKTLGERTNCMCPNCKNKAIKSHVLQKRGVLADISPEKHLYVFQPQSPFQNPPISFVRRGINDAFTFFGFCNAHDHELFYPIEKNEVDWFSTKSQFLLGYRTLCRELDIKRRMLSLLTHNENRDEARIQGLIDGIRDLQYYKRNFERGIFKDDYSGYDYVTLEAPFYIEVCLSAMVVPSYSSIPNMDTCFAEIPENNLVHIFPYKQKMIVMVGLTKHTNNMWANTLIHSIKKCSNLMSFSKIVNDVMLLWTDYYCMSEKLYNSIPSNEIDDFVAEWIINGGNHSVYRSSNINIFHSYVDSVK